jgi:microcystin-dependent protein
MAEPFLSEIRIMSFNFPPKGWAQCDGGLMPINQNQALFALIGTTYGGDGRTTCALPDLRARIPIHRSNGHTVGERGGETSHTLTQAEMPAHNHLVMASALADANGTSNVTNNFLGGAATTYHEPSNLQQMHPQNVASVGGSQAHVNTQPSLTLNFCIALQGIFPSRD